MFKIFHTKISGWGSLAGAGQRPKEDVLRNAGDGEERRDMRPGQPRRLFLLRVSATCSSFDVGAVTHILHVCAHTGVLDALLLIMQADDSCIPGENWVLFGQHFSLCKEKVGGAQRATV